MVAPFAFRNSAPKTHRVGVGPGVVETIGLNLARGADSPGRGCGLSLGRKEQFNRHPGTRRQVSRADPSACRHILRMIAIACSQRERSTRKSSSSKPDPSLHSDSENGPGTMASPYNSRPSLGQEDCSSASLWSGSRRAEAQNFHLRRRETLQDRTDLQLSRSP
jgi:hypothetical protein